MAPKPQQRPPPPGPIMPKDTQFLNKRKKTHMKSLTPHWPCSFLSVFQQTDGSSATSISIFTLDVIHESLEVESILSHSQSQLEPQRILGQPQRNLKGGTEYWLVCSALSQVYKSHCLGISLYQSDASSLKSLITFICLLGGWLNRRHSASWEWWTPSSCKDVKAL